MAIRTQLEQWADQPDEQFLLKLKDLKNGLIGNLAKKVALVEDRDSINLSVCDQAHTM